MKWLLRTTLILSASISFSADHSFGGESLNIHRQHADHFTKNPDNKDDLKKIFLFGDWGGGRRYLASKGITVGLSYVDIAVGNPYGGKARGFENSGSLGLDVNVDIGSFSRFKGLSFYSSTVFRVGKSLSGQKIDNQFPVQQNFGGQNLRLNEVYFRQDFDRANFVAKVGRLDAGNDFLQSALFYQFINNGFDGNPIAIFFNGPFSAYPNATWGVYTQFNPFFKRVLAKFAVYVAQDNIGQNRFRGFNWSFNGSDGLQLISEWAYQMNQLKGDPPYPGNLRVGYFYYTKSKGTTFLNEPYSGNSSYYFLADQQFLKYRLDQRDNGLTAFVNLLFASKDRNMFPFFFSIGLVSKGMSKSRPNDYTQIGYIYGKYSRDLRLSKELSAASASFSSADEQPQNYESIFEVNHWFHLKEYFKMVPNIQYVINPKGKTSIPNALVLGMQVVVVI